MVLKVTSRYYADSKWLNVIVITTPDQYHAAKATENTRV